MTWQQWKNQYSYAQRGWSPPGKTSTRIIRQGAAVVWVAGQKGEAEKDETVVPGPFGQLPKEDGRHFRGIIFFNLLG